MYFSSERLDKASERIPLGYPHWKLVCKVYTPVCHCNKLNWEIIEFNRSSGCLGAILSLGMLARLEGVRGFGVGIVF